MLRTEANLQAPTQRTPDSAQLGPSTSNANVGQARTTTAAQPNVLYQNNFLQALANHPTQAAAGNARIYLDRFLTYLDQFTDENQNRFSGRDLQAWARNENGLDRRDLDTLADHLYQEMLGDEFQGKQIDSDEAARVIKMFIHYLSTGQIAQP